MELSFWWKCYYACRVKTNKQRLPLSNLSWQKYQIDYQLQSNQYLHKPTGLSLPCEKYQKDVFKYLSSAQSHWVLLLYYTSSNRCSPTKHQLLILYMCSQFSAVFVKVRSHLTSQPMFQWLKSAHKEMHISKSSVLITFKLQFQHRCYRVKL